MRENQIEISQLSKSAGILLTTKVRKIQIPQLSKSVGKFKVPESISYINCALGC